MHYILYVFYALFPFVTYKFLYGGTSSRFINIAFIVSVLFISLLVKSFVGEKRVYISKSWILAGVVLYGFVVLLSGLIGTDFHTSLWSTVTRTSGIVYFAYVSLLVLGLVQIFRGRTQVDRLILVVISSAAVYSLFTLLGHQGWALLSLGSTSDSFTFGNSSFAAMYVFGAFLLSIYYLLKSEIKKWWMYIIPIVLIIGPNILNKAVWSLDFSNGLIGEARATSYAVILSIFVLGIIWIISKIKTDIIKKRVAYITFAFSVLAGIIFSVSLLSEGGFVRDLYSSRSTAARPIVWEMSSKVISERPFLGWGLENFERGFESKYDNRLLQDEYGAEAWFDRAHNVVVDQLVDNGYIGLIAYLLLYGVIILSMIYSALNANERSTRLLASVLVAYFVAHLFELQTAFDTTISYPMVVLNVFLAVYVYGVVRRSFGHKTEWELSGVWSKLFLGASVVFILWSLLFGVFPFVASQIANLKMRTIGTTEARILEYEKVFSTPIDVYGFAWRASRDFQVGITRNPQVLSNQNNLSILKKEMEIFESTFRDIIKNNPQHFRAYLNLADVLVFQSIFGVDKLSQAQDVLDRAIEIVPQAPQSYWMKSVTYLYMKKFDLAKEYAKKAYDLNPDIKESARLIDYINQSIKTFPEINLFQFKQI